MARRKPEPTAVKKLEGNPGNPTFYPVVYGLKDDEIIFKWLRMNMWVSSTTSWIPDAERVRPASAGLFFVCIIYTTMEGFMIY